MLVAETVSFGGEGRTCGAVKMPLELIDPHEDPEQPNPLSVKLIPVLGFPADVMPA